MTEVEVAERDRFAVDLYHRQEAERNARVAATPAAYLAWPVTVEYYARLEAAEAITDQESLWGTLVDILCDWHEDRCAICGFRERRWDLMMDHDHATSFVRGFLCRSCNFHEGGGLLRHGDAVYTYRANPPAAVLGIQVAYWDRIHGYAEPEPPPPTFDEIRGLAALRVQQILSAASTPLTEEDEEQK